MKTKHIWEATYEDCDIIGKNKYPIVYENKKYYYCKEYGNDELKRFNKSDIGIITVDKYSGKPRSMVDITDIEISKALSDFIAYKKVERREQLEKAIDRYQQWIDSSKSELKSLKAENQKIKEIIYGS